MAGRRRLQRRIIGGGVLVSGLLLVAVWRWTPSSDGRVFEAVGTTTASEEQVAEAPLADDPVRRDLGEASGSAALAPAAIEPSPTPLTAEDCTLEVELHGPDGPLAEGSIRLHCFALDTAFEVRIDPLQRRATLRGMPAGEWRIAVVEAPAGLSLPREQLLRGGAARRVVLSPGTQRVVFELEAGAHVWGYVSLDDPLLSADAAVVRGKHLAEPGEVSFATVTMPTSGGRYQAWLPVGRWLFAAAVGGSVLAEDQPSAPGLGYPRLGSFPSSGRIAELRVGESTRLDFDLVQGRWTLRGRIVDTEGLAIAALPVTIGMLDSPGGDEVTSPAAVERIAGITRIETDADGRFEARALIAGTYRVMAAAGSYHPLAAPGENSLGIPGHVETVELRADGSHSPLEWTLPRAHPQEAWGRVDVDPHWARSVSATNADPAVELVLNATAHRSAPSRYPIRLREGEFRFWLEASEDPLLVLSLAGRSEVYPLQLLPEHAPGASPQVLSFP